MKYIHTFQTEADFNEQVNQNYDSLNNIVEEDKVELFVKPVKAIEELAK